MRIRTIHIIMALFCLIVTACTGPEEKKVKFFEKGQQYQDEGDLLRARLEFKNAIQIDPKFAEAHFRLGQVQMGQGNYQGAYKSFTRTVELDPKNLQAQLELGKLLLASGDTEGAMARAEEVLTDEPQREEARLLKAAALLRQDQVPEARQLLEELRGEGSAPVELYLLLSRIVLTEGQSEEAAKILEEGVSAHSGASPLRVRLAEVLVRQGRLDGAAEQILEVVKQEPESAGFRFTLAELYLEGGRQKEAQNVLSDLIAAAPEKPEIRKQLGQFWSAKGDLQRAEQAFAEGMEAFPENLELRTELAALMTRVGRIDEALQLLRSSLELERGEKDPRMETVRTALAQIYLGQQRFALAEEQVKTILQRNPGSLEGHLLQGKMALMQGTGDFGVSEFRMVVDEKPQFTEGYRFLAEAHMAGQNLRLAREAVEDGLELAPSSLLLHRVAARIAAQEKDFDGAEGHLRTALEGEPDNAAVRAELGDLYRREGLEEKALAQYREITRRTPGETAGHLNICQMHLEKGRWEEALAEARSGMKSHPQSMELFAMAVQALMKGEKGEEAIAACEKRLGDDSENPLLYDLLATVHAAQGHFAKAEVAVKKAIALQPLWMPPHSRLADLVLEQGTAEKVMSELSILLTEEPSSPSALTLAQLCLRTGKVREAIALYQGFLEKHPELWTVANDLAFLLAENGPSDKELEEALHWADKAQAAQPGHPSVLDTLGWIYLKKGETAKAVGLISRAQRGNPGNPVVMYHLGVAYHRIGEKGPARKWLGDALASGEHFEGRKDAQEILAQLKG